MSRDPTILEKKSQNRHLHWLLSLHDAEFIRQSYIYILGRDADADGLEYNVSRLRVGFSKLTILGDMRRSPEGRQVSRNLKRLDRLLRTHSRCNLPVVGFLFRLFGAHESDLPSERHQRAILNELGRLRNELAAMPLALASATPLSAATIAHAPDHSREAGKQLIMSSLGPHDRRIFSHLAAQIPA